MTKKIIKTFLKILIIVLVYLLQVYVINDITFFGVTGDLCLMLVALTALIDEKHIAYIIHSLNSKRIILRFG